MNIALIVLAAGGSSRMGTAKQLLVFNGKTLLRRAVETGVGSGCSPVVVVLGEDAARMRAEVIDPRVMVAINPDWREGMGSSIRVGIEKVERMIAADAVVITVCDQPRIDTKAINELLEVYKNAGKSMVAASYGGTLGVPAIFSRRYFPALGQLSPGSGAKQVLMQNLDDVTTVLLDDAAFDVDTPQDYQNLRDAK